MENIASIANPQPHQSATDFRADAATAPVSRSGTSHQVHPTTGGFETSQQTDGGQQRRSQQMACLYTKQKTQKKKKWHDGRLLVHSMGVSLFDAHPPPGSGDPKLDECCLSRLQCDALIRQMESRLETEKFLVQVEGPWIAPTAFVKLAKPNALVSQGMKKVITRKFQKPGKYVPKHPMQEQQNQPPGMRKQQRQPLQPGELQRRYYGDAMSQQAGPPPNVPSAWNQGMQQGPPPPQTPVAPRFDNLSRQPPFQQQGQQPQQPFQQARPNMASNGYGNAMVRQHQYNTPAHATGAHQAASHQHAVHPPRHPPEHVQGANSFVGNKFNANQFYGEDEECSQEEEEGEDDGWNLQQAPPRNVNPQQSMGAPYQTRDSTAKPRAPNSFCSTTISATAALPSRQATTPSRGSGGNTSGNNGNSAALSTDELLKLFGANPTVPSAPTAQTNVDKPTPGQPEPTQQEVDSSKYEFVLPPAASDSSSEEESDSG